LHQSVKLAWLKQAREILLRHPYAPEQGKLREPSGNGAVSHLRDFGKPQINHFEAIPKK
jgi:hypothetical protein